MEIMQKTVDLNQAPVEMSARLRVMAPQIEDGISTASVMRQAQSLLPEEFDAEGNSDLMPVVFDLAVINEFNRNHDGVDIETAISFVKNFSHKPINLDHVKPNIVGHIVNASITEKPFEYQDNDIESFAGRTDRLYITAVGVVYKRVFKELAEAISDKFQSTDYDSYLKSLVLSASWELAFANYQMAIGSKILSECEIVEDDEHGTMEKLLPKFGGSGYDINDKRVNRLIKSPVIPLGAAFTFDPAAEVEGVEEVVSDPENNNANKLPKKNSPKAINNVSIENVLDMEPKELTTKIEEAVASALQTSDASSARAVITQAIEEHAKTWKSQVEAETEAKAKVEKNLAEVNEQLATTSKELKDLQEEVRASKAVEAFNTRMNVINDLYDFSDQENKFVASEVRELGLEDEAFASYQSKLEVVFAHKSKAAKEESEKEFQKKLDEALAAKLEENGIKPEGEKEEETKELETEEVKANLPNNNRDKEQKSLLDQFKGKFEVEVK